MIIDMHTHAGRPRRTGDVAQKLGKLVGLGIVAHGELIDDPDEGLVSYFVGNNPDVLNPSLR